LVILTVTVNCCPSTIVAGIDTETASDGLVDDVAVTTGVLVIVIVSVDVTVEVLIGV